MLSESARVESEANRSAGRVNKWKACSPAFGQRAWGFSGGQLDFVRETPAQAGRLVYGMYSERQVVVVDVVIGSVIVVVVVVVVQWDFAAYEAG